ncbi:goF mRNA metabolism modulator [Pectobacterium bacteriophage PM2]|uniref:Uncharacterized protein n=1 Tax=Pectobacterium bacteriophage PM2 TaxID=1429794 RepID=A0A0A0Q2B8_9CAUD|nr:goF mRNA metabolism modulator [Pectobacterium bacteriophage PM2]AHY24970.1 hypothetical protein PM2_008 [Pectobacterium bacteriophage PM2]
MFKLNHWYSFKDTQSMDFFMDSSIYNEDFLNWAGTNNFVVKRLTVSGYPDLFMNNDGDFFPEEENEGFIIRDGEFKYFKEVDGQWTNDSYYVIIDPTGLINHSKLNNRLLTYVGSNAFKVIKLAALSQEDQFAKVSKIEFLGPNGLENINFTLTHAELRYFKKVENYLGHSVKFRPFFKSGEDLVEPINKDISIIAEGAFNIRVEDEQTRLLAIDFLTNKVKWAK